MVDGKNDQRGKMIYSSIPVTPGCSRMSPLRKQTRQETSRTNDQASGGGDVPESIKHLEARNDELFDRKINEMQACIESLLTMKLTELEKKFDEKVAAVKVEFQELKDDYNQSLHHVEQDLETKIAAAREHATGKLLTFLHWYQNSRVKKKNGNLTSLTQTDMPANPGKKGGQSTSMARS